MADKATGEWGTLALSLPEIDLLAGLDALRAIINSIVDFILAVLDIALAILNLIKTFLKSFLDPIVALVQAIIDELIALIRSFRDIGLYFTGDWGLLEYPFEDLKGGFGEYERRMVSRLTDRTDPTRPQASSSVQTFAVFFYLSVDASGIHRLIGFINQILRFFNLSFRPKGSLPTPTITNVVYGTDATNILNFDTLTNLTRLDPDPPNVARVSWKAVPAVTSNPLKPFPSLPPKHYLITVSTVPDGIPLYYDRPRGDTDTKEGKGSEKVQPREYGPVLDYRGNPVILHGGYEMVDFDKSIFGWNESLDSDGNVKPGKARVYGVGDPAKNSIIPLEELFHVETGADLVFETGAKVGSGTTRFYLWQRTFTTDELEVSFQWASDEFSIDLSLEDLPWHATVVMEDGEAVIKDIRKPATYYVRVASTGPDSIDTSKEEGDRNRFVYNLATGPAANNATASGQPFIVNVGRFEDAGKSFVLSDWSEPETVTFSNAYTKEYLEAVRVALVLLVLCRVDLPVIDELEDLVEDGVLESASDHKRMLPDVALKATGLERFRRLLGQVYSDLDAVMRSSGESPISFRRELLNRVNQVATDLYRTSGPMPAVEGAVVAATEKLRTVTWAEIFGDRRGETDPFARKLSEGNDMTILESLGRVTEDGSYPGLQEDMGVALNPFCIGVDEDLITNLKFFSGTEGKVFRDRKPHFIEVGRGGGAFGFNIRKHVPRQDVSEFLDDQPSGLRMLYEHYVLNEDVIEGDTVRFRKGDIVVEEEASDWFNALQNLKTLEGSADRSPVFYQGRNFFGSTTAVKNGGVDISYCRTLLAEYQNGQLMQEAGVALGVAGAAHQRAPQDGAWLSVRLGDIFPPLDAFFDQILNWLDSIKAGLQSVADVLIAYIEFLEARIIELQQLIRRINSLIQLSFSFSLSLPKVSGLVLSSSGTDGVLSDFIGSENKPQDSPLSYGAGVAIVAPSFPAFLAQLFNISDDPATGTVLDDSGVDIFGIEDLPEEELNPPSDPEPDVL